MHKLNDYRKKIDKIDNKIMKSLDERFFITKRIGILKKNLNIPTTDINRENEILDKSSSYENGNSINKIYHKILEESKNNQSSYALALEDGSYTYSDKIHNRFNNEFYQVIETEDLLNVIKTTNIKNFNISNPLKNQGFDICQNITERAKATNVINFINEENNELLGDNLDIDAFLNMINYYNIDFENKNIIVIGNGATSRTICYALKSLNIQSLVKLVRNKKDQNEILINEMPFNLSADILIDATSFDVYPNFENEPLFDINKILGLKVFITVNYNPNRSIMYQQACKLGIKCYNGLMMLIENARLSENIWQNKEYPISYSKIIMDELLHDLNIVLIGQSGAGKTTIGDTLSFVLNRPHLNSDNIINKKITLTINNTTNNLKEFRFIEGNVIFNISHIKKAIISVGAGAIEDEQNIINLKRNGIIVFIQTPLDTLIERFNNGKLQRPLLKSVDDVKTLYQKREQLYLNAADIIINGNCDIMEIAEKIKEKVNEHINHKWL